MIRKCSVIALWCSVALFAAARKDSQAEVTLRTTTRLIQVSIVAENWLGYRIDDLQRTDFRIYDNGRLQEIRYFEGPRTREHHSAPQTQTGSTSVFSNRTEPASPGGITVFLIDEMNTGWTDLASVRKQVLEYLREVHPEDRLALYTMDFTGFHVLHDFTRDSSDLIAALDNWRAKAQVSSSAVTAGVTPELFRWMNGTERTYERRQVQPDAGMNTQDSLGILTAISRHLAGIPGRKNLIWISAGFPEVQWDLDQAGYVQPMNSGMRRMSLLSPSAPALAHGPAYSSEWMRANGALRVINDANVAVYPIDARGLISGSPGAEEHSVPSHDVTARLVNLHANHQMMDKLADRTGGRAAYNTNDFVHAIHSALDDAETSYVLGYYAADSAADGRFHRIKVEVPGRHAIGLHYRRGYSDAAEAPDTIGRRKIELTDASSSPIDATAVAITAQVTPMRTGQYMVALRVDPSGLDLQPKEERWAGSVDVVLVQRDDRGGQYEPIHDTLVLDLPAARYQAMMKSTHALIYRRPLALNAKATSLRIVLRDAGSGNLGSLTIPVRAFRP